uniref:Plasma membrane fusion protein PRM1 n=1 Tax=Ditylenchus dipsaci TaxID=166011 RepID=A0A915ENG9_9BILA
MSVDKTIEELSGTLAQLGVLVEHINAQIIGITSRINLTLDNFDHSVAGIATDAGLMTGQVGDTISQIPNAWVFYLLFITLIVVLILLSILIIINLVSRIHSIIRLIQGESSRTTTPLPSMIYSESKQPLNISYPGSPRDRLRHIAVPMETEPRRFGFGSQFAPKQTGEREEFTYGNRGSFAHQGRSQEVSEPYISRRQPYQPSPTEFDGSPRRFNSENGDGLPPMHQREAVLLQSQYQSSTTTSQVPPFISPRAEAV